MKRSLRCACYIVLGAYATTLSTSPVQAQNAEDPAIRPFNQNIIIDDSELTDVESMSVETMRRFFSHYGGGLAAYRTLDVDGAERDAAEIIWRVAHAYGINPQWLLTLIQREQSLVENPHPSQRDLDWATGYAVCDGCSTDDPAIQKFKGFAIQIDRAAWRQRYYLDHPKEFGVRVGEAVVIDGTFVVPSTQATANLYIYTPHISGNQNFYTIWNRYFARRYPDGSLLEERGTNNVWLLTNGRLRLVSSRSILLTDFDLRRIIPVATSDILRYDIGPVIKFPNYSLLRSPGGTVYLLVDEVRHGIASREILRGLGFNPEEILDVTWDDLRVYSEGSSIVTTGAKPLGELVQDRTTGGIYYVSDGIRHAIWSKEILKNRYTRYPVVAVEPRLLSKFPLGDPVKFRDGELVTAPGLATVYVISHGEKRPIASAEVFSSLGYQWSNVITTSLEALTVHPDGPPVTG